MTDWTAYLVGGPKDGAREQVSAVDDGAPLELCVAEDRPIEWTAEPDPLGAPWRTGRYAFAGRYACEPRVARYEWRGWDSEASDTPA